MAWVVGSLVDVRAAGTLPWREGTVRSVGDLRPPHQECYGVELDIPVSADAWEDTTRRYGGSDLVGTALNLVYVHEHADKLVPDELIRSR